MQLRCNRLKIIYGPALLQSECTAVMYLGLQGALSCIVADCFRLLHVARRIFFPPLLKGCSGDIYLPSFGMVWNVPGNIAVNSAIDSSVPLNTSLESASYISTGIQFGRDVSERRSRKISFPLNV